MYIKTTSSSGETKYVQGKVDYVVYENGKAYLSINESLYSIEDLDTVVDADYMNAYNKASDFVVSMNKLPNVDGVDESDLSAIEALEKIYTGMTDYEKSFLAKDVITRMEAYIEKAKQFRQDTDD